MFIRAKIGTTSMQIVRVLRKRKAPQVGDCFSIHEDLDNLGRPERYKKPSSVRCCEIREFGGFLLYILERF